MPKKKEKLLFLLEKDMHSMFSYGGKPMSAINTTITYGSF